MAEFCRKHCIEIMGIDPKKHPEWVCEYGFICEECGYDYMEEDKTVNNENSSQRIFVCRKFALANLQQVCTTVRTLPIRRLALSLSRLK